MTTPQEGIDDARPLAGDAVETAEAAPQAPQTPTFTDVDDIELQQAMAAAQAEEAAPDAELEPEVVAGAKPPAEAAEGQPPAPEAQAEKPAPTSGVPMIPKPRFDEVRTRAEQLAQEAAYWRGMAEARGQQPGTPGAPAAAVAPQLTPEQRLAAIHQAQDEIAAKYDSGELTRSEEVKQLRELSNQEQAIREELLTSKFGAAKQSSPDDSLVLQSYTAQIEQEHEWVPVFEKIGNDNDWAYLRGLAVSNLAARGIDARNGALGTLELRREFGTLADQLGPALLSARATAAGIAIPGQAPPQAAPPPQPGTKPPLSATAKARADKIALAQSAPPALSQLSGTTGGTTGVPTAAQIENMSDEDIANLPDSVQRQILGVHT